jgi:hypothetical protein
MITKQIVEAAKIMISGNIKRKMRRALELSRLEEWSESCRLDESLLSEQTVLDQSIGAVEWFQYLGEKEIERGQRIR